MAHALVLFPYFHIPHKFFSQPVYVHLLVMHVYVRQKAEAELAELRSGREQTQKAHQRQQQQMSELEKKNKELSHQLDTEKQG